MSTECTLMKPMLSLTPSTKHLDQALPLLQEIRHLEQTNTVTLQRRTESEVTVI